MALSKEKLVTLTKYKQQLLDKLSTPVSSKQANRVKEYHQFLKREIAMVSARLDADLLENKKD